MTPKSEEKLKNINTLVAEIKQLASEKQELSATRQKIEDLAASYFEFQHKNTVLKTIPDTEVKNILLKYYSQKEEFLRLSITQRDDLLEDLLSGKAEVYTKSSEARFYLFSKTGGNYLKERKIGGEFWTSDRGEMKTFTEQEAKNTFLDLTNLGYKNIEILPVKNV